jgi:hypothetical protein
MSIEYLVVCTKPLPHRPNPWNQAFGPVSIALLAKEDDVRRQLEARMAGIEVTAVVLFSARAAAGHLAFQFATALAKMASGVVFDEESLDDPSADYRGYPAVVLSDGVEKVWQLTVDSERRAEELRRRHQPEHWGPLMAEEGDWTDSIG